MSVRFRFLLAAILLIPGVLGASISEQKIRNIPAKTFELDRDAVLKDEPGGKIVDIWFEGSRLTAYQQMGEWIKVSGYFPDGKWSKNSDTMWINSKDIKELYRPKPAKRRPPHIERYIVVKKSNYELKVYEKKGKKESVVYKAKVAVGMDRCLSKEEGGNCYFTDPGTYAVRWKIHDPKGIEWCIPKFMEKEKKYQGDLKNKKRCFRGSIGYYALNIGKSYAIHGTNNEASIGQSASHGCVRTKNSDMSEIFDLMQEGDKVYIVR
jgi:hypothetical protein